VKWFLVVPAAVLIAVLLAGLAYQRVATAASFRRYKAPGRMVDVGGYKLHIHCTGRGPSVVLESGLGGWSVDWTRVQPGVERFARVCSYDRSGMGWSERGPASASTREGIAKQLKQLLDAADVPPPYILVGHSLGGIYVREFARRYAGDVAGMVFVDSSHEEMGKTASKKEREEIESQVRILKIARYLMPFGLQRIIKLPVANAEELPADVRPLANGIGYRSISYLSFYDEIAPLLAADHAGTLRLEPVPDVPIVALASESNISKHDNWKDLQQELAGLSSHGRLVVAEGSGHFIQVDRPELVIEAIDDVARRTSKASKDAAEQT
jgi:pimeloyl-ACP methyl ester carboxylesterase